MQFSLSIPFKIKDILTSTTEVTSVIYISNQVNFRLLFQWNKDMDSFGKEALEAHNNFRKAHQAPPLTWSSTLARDAEAWAKQIAREGRLRHDDTKDGENVFMVFGREIDGSDAVNSWYSEVKDYSFSKSGYQSNTGHFTQVVWKGSKELGIGRAKSADGKVFVVGRYRPAGNNMRAFKENVFPSKVSKIEPYW